MVPEITEETIIPVTEPIETAETTGQVNGNPEPEARQPLIEVVKVQERARGKASHSTPTSVHSAITMIAQQTMTVQPVRNSSNGRKGSPRLRRVPRRHLVVEALLPTRGVRNVKEQFLLI